MIGYGKQGFAAQAEPFGLHRCRHHLESFPCAHGVCKQCIAAVEDVRHGVSLMLPKLDFGVHAAENDMTSVVLTGTQAVEFIVVKAAEPFSALRVRPDPILKALLDQLLLCLCDCRFLFVQDGFLFAVCVLYIVEDADILQVQRFLDDLIGVDTLRAIGAVRLHIAAVIGFALNVPFAGIGREMNLDVPLCVPRCSQELKHKLFDNFGRQPSSTKPNGNLAGGQVFGLHSFQCFHIDCVIFGVKLR